MTGADGRFEIKGLPAGEFRIVLWHERLGTKESKVKVAAGSTADLGDLRWAEPK